MEALRLCVVIPTFNNRNTLEGVLKETLRYTSSVIVVNDGSTDGTDEVLSGFEGGAFTTVSRGFNRGKGRALGCGFDRAEELGFRGAVTIDADGQHFASEIERFVEGAEMFPGALLLGQRLVVGDVPGRNRMAHRVSNFWFAVQTAYRFSDTQNGFRLYPLDAMKGMRPLTSRFEAELELLVRAAWRGIRIVPVPIRVFYPPEGERVSHFRPGRDFFRISVLNVFFTLAAFIYGYPVMLFRRLARLRRE
jgi:glycosyltransferase involved in cell wall biosynthesis